VSAGQPVAMLTSGSRAEVEVTVPGMQTTFPVRVRLDDETAEIRPGMAAEVAFVFRTSTAETERVRAPTWSVGEDRDGNFVWVVEPTDDGLATVRRRRVTVGEVMGDHIEVRESLVAGDRVVTAGVSRITDGMTVRVLPVSP